METPKTYGEILELETPKKENIMSKLTDEEKEIYNEIKTKDKDRLLTSSGNNKQESITFNKPIKNQQYIPGIGKVSQVL